MSQYRSGAKLTTGDADMMSPKPAPAFDATSCRVTLDRACAQVGLSSEGAELIRIGENALFHLRRHGLVARISRYAERMADAKKELRVAGWLASEGVATAAPLDIPQPLLIDDYPVTFWQYVTHDSVEPTLAELGGVLRSLHGLTPPPSLDLPIHDMFGMVPERIERARGISEADLAYMQTLHAELQDQYSSLEFPLGECAIHGDAHTGNLLHVVGDGIALIDLERFAFGHPEADLSTPAVEYQIGWFCAEDYRSFVESYGFDVMDWDGFPILRTISELKMTTWLMQNVGHSREIDEEIRRRIESLRRPKSPRSWQPF